MPINQQEKIRLFDYLTHFEKNIKNNRGHYDLRNNQLQTFINENDIAFCSYLAKGTKTLDAKIKTEVFWNFLNELENTYH